ncbi:serine-rich adhesin for platelets-like [Physella acuta]|uniref:serine-rich adhesin for platelets-like n=1 Tax=Physella acuta TaxID=109671 RepID=UPI0027DAB6FA|nr:serine-rich adhesin for platelets-like [Physella acuta]
MDSSDPSGAQESQATLLFCRMCQAVYRQPKLLPCLHSFCRPCIVNAVSHSAAGGTVVVCPQCSYQARLPPNGIVGIPDNPLLNRLCQQYLSEVQTHLVARSLQADPKSLSPKPSEFTALRSRLSEELTHPKFTPSDSPKRSHSSGSSRPSSVGSAEDVADTGLSADVFTVDRGPSSNTATTIEAIRNMSRIQTKIMSLQGQALKVTYAIDQVNQSMIEWHRHKEDLKRAVERRSAQFQFYIKRMEHQLLNQIDSKMSDDQFYGESDQSKTELRKNLKNILHEVSVLKCVQDLGKDAEVNTLSPAVLSKSVGMTEVKLKKLHYDIIVPAKSLEELVNEAFGHVALASEDTSVFAPEVLDFTDIQLGLSSDSPVRDSSSVTLEEEVERVSKEDDEVEKSKKRSSERRSRRHNTDLGLESTDVKEYLAQFQTARETFRNRRKEILQQGQLAREDASPMRHEVKTRPRSNSRNGRVQSLDRSNIPMTRGRSLLPSRMAYDERQTQNTAGAASNPSSETMIQYQFGAASGMRIDDISLPSPVIEEASVPSSPIKRLVKQTSDPRYSADRVSSPEEASGSDIFPGHDHYQTSVRRHSSDQVSPLMLKDYVPLEIHKSDPSSRPVRRAISSASDRRSKIEYLRENWQRRKEILKQSEGFVSSDSQHTRPLVMLISTKTPPQSPLQAKPTITTIEEHNTESYPTHEGTSPPLSPRHIASPIQHVRSGFSKFQSSSLDSGGKYTSDDSVGRQRTESAKSELSKQAEDSTNRQVFNKTEVKIDNRAEEETKISDKQTAETHKTLTREITPETIPVVQTNIVQEEQTNIVQKPTEVTKTESTVMTKEPVTSPVTASTTTSKYARNTTVKPKTDSIDVMALIANFYKAGSTTTQTSTTTTASVATGQTSVSVTSSTSSTPTTSAESNAPTVTSPTSNLELRYQQIKSRYSSIFATSSTTATTTSESNKSTAAGDTSTPVTTSTQPPPAVTGYVRKYEPIGPRYGSSYSTRTTTSAATTSAVTDNGQQPKDVASTTSTTSTTATTENQQVPATTGYVRRFEPIRPRYSSSYLSSTAASTAPAAPATKEPDSVQTETNTATTTTPETATIDQTSTESASRYEPRRSRYTASGFNRRHTIEVGKSDIQEALALNSRNGASVTPMQPPITTSSTSSAAQPSNIIIQTTEPEADMTKVTFKIGPRGGVTKYIPTPLNLEPLEEGSVLESQSPVKKGTSISAAIAAIRSPSPSLSPTSPSGGDKKGNLREIARKKKERWRHLTIH